MQSDEAGWEARNHEVSACDGRAAERDGRYAAERSDRIADGYAHHGAAERVAVHVESANYAVGHDAASHAECAAGHAAGHAECDAADHDATDHVAGDAELAAFRCPVCDARYVAREANAATTCPWCGSHLQPAGPAFEEEVPDFAVPFSVGREQAVESLNKFVRNTWFTPDDFEVEVTRTQAVYVPYWLFGARAWETLTILDRINGGRSQSFWGTCQSAQATYGDLAVSASRLMPPFYMEAAGLFFIDDRRSPSEAFAEGVVAEAPDAPANEKTSQAKEIAGGMLHDWLLSKTTSNTGENLGYDWCKGLSVEQIAMSRGVEIVERKGEVRITDWRLCALPVWLLHCTREGEETLFVVNGQTGTCAGNLVADNANMARDASPAFELRIAIGILATFVLAYLCWKRIASQPTLDQRVVERVAEATICFGILWAWVLHAAPVRSTGTHCISVREMAEGSRVLRPTIDQRITAHWQSKQAKNPKRARRHLEERMGSKA